MLVHPFDHPDIIAGQGTVGLELLEQCPDVRTVLVGTGGGGLVAGIGVAVKALRPDVAVVAVQAEEAAAYPASLAAGPAGRRWTGWRRWPTGSPSAARATSPSRSFEDVVDEVVTVSEDAISRALLLCLERAKMVVEPAGAAAVAAVLEEPRAVRAAGGGGAVRRQRRPGAAAAGDPARHGRGRPLPVRAGPDRRPAGRAGRAARAGGRAGRERAGRRALPDHLPARTWARSRSRCRWRPAARSTGPSCWPRCARPGTRRACPDRPGPTKVAVTPAAKGGRILSVPAG